MSQDIWATVASVVTILVFEICLSWVCQLFYRSKTKSLEYCHDKIPIPLLHFLSIKCHSSDVLALYSK